MSNHPIYVIQINSYRKDNCDYDHPQYNHIASLRRFNYAGAFSSMEIDNVIIDESVAGDGYEYRRDLMFTGYPDKYLEMSDKLKDIFIKRNPSIKKEYFQ